MPKDVTINVQLQQLTKRIPYLEIFLCLTNRGSVLKRERNIVNLDNADGSVLNGWRTRSGKIMLFTLIVSTIFNHRKN